jgi:hypothetical protein
MGGGGGEKTRYMKKGFSALLKLSTTASSPACNREVRRTAEGFISS